MGKQDKEFRQRRDDCAETKGRKITSAEFVKKYGLDVTGPYFDNDYAVREFCSFYLNGILEN